ncbi:MAG TPA: hypothetical protein VNJ01_13770 [Bacteriovoracaceae bacterium]|nr:hypothetical protein [Bacteriovoracaceae bacterium]
MPKTLDPTVFDFGGIREFTEEDVEDVYSFCNYDVNREGETQCSGGFIREYGNFFSCWRNTGMSC